MGKGSRRAARHAAALDALRRDEGDTDGGLRVPAGERTERGYTVRSVGASDRAHRCPGCDQEIRRVPHIVAWPVGDPDARRHWHTPCWTARDRRAPLVLRGRSAPRR